MDMENAQMDMENGNFGRFWTLWGLFGDSEIPCPTRVWTIWTVFTKKVFILLIYFLQTFFKEMYPNRPIPWGSKDYKIPKVSKTNPL